MRTKTFEEGRTSHAFFRGLAAAQCGGEAASGWPWFQAELMLKEANEN